MEIYLVECDFPDSHFVDSVWDSKEKAEQRIRELMVKDSYGPWDLVVYKLNSTSEDTREILSTNLR